MMLSVVGVMLINMIFGLSCSTFFSSSPGHERGNLDIPPHNIVGTSEGRPLKMSRIEVLNSLVKLGEEFCRKITVELPTKETKIDRGILKRRLASIFAQLRQDGSYCDQHNGLEIWVDEVKGETLLHPIFVRRSKTCDIIVFGTKGYLSIGDKGRSLICELAQTRVYEQTGTRVFYAWRKLCVYRLGKR